jgi:hypothetical protein
MIFIYWNDNVPARVGGNFNVLFNLPGEFNKTLNTREDIYFY